MSGNNVEKLSYTLNDKNTTIDNNYDKAIDNIIAKESYHNKFKELMEKYVQNLIEIINEISTLQYGIEKNDNFLQKVCKVLEKVLIVLTYKPDHIIATGMTMIIIAFFIYLIDVFDNKMTSSPILHTS